MEHCWRRILAPSGALQKMDLRTSNLRTTNHAIGLLQSYCPGGMVCATLAHLENEADDASCCNVVHELMPHRTPSGRNGPGGCNRCQVALRIEPQLCRNAKIASWCAHALALTRKHIHTSHTHTHALMRPYRGRLETIGRWKPRRHPIDWALCASGSPTAQPCRVSATCR